MSAETRKRSIADFLTAERSRLIRYVRRLIDETAEMDAEDIVQDVALSLFSRADVSMPIENLSAYVFESLRHRVIDIFRRRKHLLVPLDEHINDQETSSLAHLVSEMVFDTEREIARSALRRNIFEAIDVLPDDQKAVVIETELNGRSFRELSKAWEIPIGTLLSRKSRALAKIRTSLKEFKP
jgi:RNA polymerase sigma factor (sigma-70 family)